MDEETNVKDDHDDEKAPNNRNDAIFDTLMTKNSEIIQNTKDNYLTVAPKIQQVEEIIAANLMEEKIPIVEDEPMEAAAEDKIDQQTNIMMMYKQIEDLQQNLEATDAKILEAEKMFAEVREDHIKISSQYVADLKDLLKKII